MGARNLFLSSLLHIQTLKFKKDGTSFANFRETEASYKPVYTL